MLCWPTLSTHHLNICWMVVHSGHTCITILYHLWTYSMNSPLEYWLNHPSVTPIFPALQYWITCSLALYRYHPENGRIIPYYNPSYILVSWCHFSTLHNYHVSIGWTIGPSDFAFIAILKQLLAHSTNSPISVELSVNVIIQGLLYCIPYLLTSGTHH